MREWFSGWGILDVILLVAAIFLFFKLRSLLGQGGRIDAEEQTPSSSPLPTSNQKTLPLPEELTDDQLWDHAVKGDHLGPSMLQDRQGYLDIIHELRILDPSFTIDLFLERVCEVYEAVTTAYAKGDFDTLRFYLAQPVYKTFESSIRARQADEKELSRALVGFRKVQAEGLYFSATEIKVAVSFLCDVVWVIKDKEGKVLEGDPINARPVKDHWLFFCDRMQESRWIVSETS